MFGTNSGHSDQKESIRSLNGETRHKIEDILKDVTAVTDIREEVRQKVEEYRKSHEKSESKAKNFIDLGSKFLEKKEYKSALNAYNKAILSTPFPTESDKFGDTLCLSFAGKALVESRRHKYVSALFAANSSLEFSQTFGILWLKVNCLRHLGRLEESLKLLDQLIDMLVTDKTIDIKLETIQEIKQTRISVIEHLAKIDGQKIQKNETLIKESEESNEDTNQFFINGKIDVQESQKKGRHFVATQSIPKGTSLLTESPIVYILRDRTSYCDKCLKPLVDQFWPCIGCDELAFCDRQCWLTAYNDHHKYECGLIGVLEDKKSEIETEFQMAFKLISKLGVRRAMDLMQSIGCDRSALEEYMKSEDKDFETKIRAFSCLYDNNGCGRNLNEEKIDINLGIKTAFLLSFINDLDFDVERDYHSLVNLSELCVKTARKVRFNRYDLKKESDRKTLGTVVFIMASFFNHSCDPNVSYTTSGGKFVAKTLSDIEIGKELTISYIPKIIKDYFIARQSHLLSKYVFACDCKKCLVDSQSFVSLRCGQCSGPVFVDLPQPIDISDRFCLRCETKFEEWKTVRDKVKYLQQDFSHLVDKVFEDGDHNLLSEAEIILKKLFLYVCPSSGYLLRCLFQLFKVYHKYGLTERAVFCGEAVESTIELQTGTETDRRDITSLLIDTLFVTTDLHYKYLMSNRMSDKRHWDRSLRFYDRLMELLKSSSVSSEESEANKPYTDREEVKGSELNRLKKWYKSFASN